MLRKVSFKKGKDKVEAWFPTPCWNSETFFSIGEESCGVKRALPWAGGWKKKKKIWIAHMLMSLNVSHSIATQRQLCRLSCDGENTAITLLLCVCLLASWPCTCCAHLPSVYLCMRWQQWRWRGSTKDGLLWRIYRYFADCPAQSLI